PLEVPAGWQIVDVVDVADLESERAHRYQAALGTRHFGDLSDLWSCYYSVTQSTGDGMFRKIADGGRTIRGAEGERFVIHADPGKPLRLLVRTGAPLDFKAAPLMSWARELIVERADTHLLLGRIAVPPPGERFSEVFLELPADPSRAAELPLNVLPEGGQIRTFHYWVLQPN